MVVGSAFMALNLTLSVGCPVLLTAPVIAPRFSTWPCVLTRKGAKHLSTRNAWSAKDIAEYFKLEQADALVGALLERKLLEQAKASSNDKTAFYEQGPDAPSLKNALLLKPISREKADVLVK